MVLDVQRRLYEGGEALIVIQMNDRRGAQPRNETWMFQLQVQQCLFGESNGAMYRLLGRMSLTRTPVCLNRSSVSERLVQQDEWDELITLFQSILPLESRGRVCGSPNPP